MQAYLNQFDYGNHDMGGGLDRFWLHGDLRISADEQVQFLQRMYYNDLGTSVHNARIVKDILVLESRDTYRLSGKTGGATTANGFGSCANSSGRLELCKSRCAA